MNNYFIKEGYRANLSSNNQVVEQYTAIPNNKTYQIPCYKMAAEMARAKGLRSCIELGSGSGFKLNKYIAPLVEKIVGIDMPHSVEHCQKIYPAVQWVADDFDNPENAIQDKFDLVISFDVIEHLVYPEKLLDKIKSYAKPGSIILISTPERDLLRGKDHNGPADNRKHVREWNKAELKEFLKSQGFNIRDHVILPDQEFSFRDYIWAIRKGENSKSRNTCQLAVCTLPK